MSDELLPLPFVRAMIDAYISRLRRLGFTREQIAEHIRRTFEECGFTLDDAIQLAAYHALHHPDPAERADAARLLTRAMEHRLR